MDTLAAVAGIDRTSVEIIAIDVLFRTAQDGVALGDFARLVGKAEGVVRVGDAHNSLVAEVERAVNVVVAVLRRARAEASDGVAAVVGAGVVVVAVFRRELAQAGDGVAAVVGAGVVVVAAARGACRCGGGCRRGGRCARRGRGGR